jgi:putative IMPACT (imprinted ancient) family translation regulator
MLTFLQPFRIVSWSDLTPCISIGLYHPQAQDLLKGSSDPTASHNCYAYKLGIRARSSDDGEPGGTAGKPILAAIEGDGLDGVCVLVTR